MGREDPERERSQCHDPTGGWEPEPGERTVCSVCVCCQVWVQWAFSLQVSLVALGPLTNLALAVRLDPCFPQKLKELYIMGGNMEGDSVNQSLDF